MPHALSLTCAAAAVGLALALAAAQAAPEPASMPMAPGPFAPDWDSLKQYRCPAWFRDAKFGIWAHWSPQCVPEQGDWYARNMYIPSTGQYAYHVEHYGHPSKVGYKDLCHLWTAAKWDPERLIALYRRAGARYFVALANHHCNFDAWDSTYQPWSSVRVGPHRDIVGTWAAVARRQGLRFGVTVHSARTWDWFNVAHGADADGPMKGVPYDGHLTRADGAGTWWEGLDPADLYCPPHPEGAPPPDWYVTKWYDRTRDLVDKYHPDLLYFDDWMLPLGDAGMRIAAHYYNANQAHHGGKLQAVLTTKGMPPELRGTLVWDIERGISDRIEPYPWQTDTCIGVWHYHRGIRYKTAGQVIAMLADIVAKNGNLLLNIPVRGDGTIDGAEVAFLEDMARWMAVNSDAIYDTRPWVVYGEGPAAGRSGSFEEGQGRPYTGRDIRFTTKKGVLYAILLGRPGDGAVTVASLSRLPGVGGRVTGVEMLGCRDRLQWSHDETGLHVTVPARKPCEHAWVLKITGERMRDFRPDLVEVDYSAPVAPDAAGDITLDTSAAGLHGAQIAFEKRTEQENVGFWDRADEWVSWKVRVPGPGEYEVTAMCATGAGASELAIEAAGQRLVAAVPATGNWDAYAEVKLGAVRFGQAGEYELAARPADPATWKPVNLTLVRLRRRTRP